MKYHMIRIVESGDILDFRQLETFIEVVKLKSFSKAAQKLFLTQPTVTSHIQNLENEVGTLLINRIGKKVTPTDAGNLLYKYALDIVNMRDMAEFDLGVYKGKIEGHLEISSSSIPRQYVLPSILMNFTKEYPDVSFSLTEKDSRKVIEGILEGETDFGIVGAKYTSNHLQYIDLIEDRLVLITPNQDKYPLENYDELDIKFLLDERLILREKGSGTRLLLEKELKNNDINIQSLNIVSLIEDNETIKRFVELGLGVSFVSERAVKREVELGILKAYRIKDLNLNRKFHFVYHKSRQLSPLSQTFKNFITNFLDKTHK